MKREISSDQRLVDATWIFGHKQEPVLDWIKKQVSAWIPLLCGGKARFANSQDADLSVVIGSNRSNRFIHEAVTQGLIDLDPLGEDDFVLKQAVLNRKPVLLIAGNSARAAAYGVCEFFEQLGCTFLISRDELPPCDPERVLPLLDVTKRTDCSWRGIFFGGYCFTTNSMMSLPDYEAMFDQMVKLKMNRIVFYHFENEPFVDFSFRGERKLVGDISHPDSGYISYGRSFTGSFRVQDLPVSREKFDRARIAPMEFQAVESSAQVLDTTKAFMQAIISLARDRGIGVWMTVLPQFLPPNLSKYTRPMPRRHPHWSAHLSSTDPAVGPLNRARIKGILEAYPDLEGLLLGIPEGFFDDPYPETQTLIEKEWGHYTEALELHKRYWGKHWPNEKLQQDHLRADIAFTEIVKKTISEAKDLKPDLKLGICTVCKAYLLTRLHQILPEDMPFIDIESRALWTHDGAPLHLFREMKGRECVIIPRAVDDGSLAGIQFPLWQYASDRFLSSPEENGTSGLMIQTTHIRGNEHSMSYLAEGMWGGVQEPTAFYRRYNRRIFGKQAAGMISEAFAILERSDEYLGGRGQANMPWNMVPDQIGIMQTFKDFDRPFHEAPFSLGFVEKCEERGKMFRQSIEYLSQALSILDEANALATESGRRELAYMSTRTKGFRAHLLALAELADLYRHYYEIFQLPAEDLGSFRQTLGQLVDEASRLESRTRESAGFFADCVSHTTDLAVLWMISHKMVLGSQCLRHFLVNIQAFYEGREYWKPVDWDKLFGRIVFPFRRIGVDKFSPSQKTTSSEPG